MKGDLSIDRVVDLLTKKKDKKVAFTFNSNLWSMFTQACKEESAKPTNKLEQLIIRYLNENRVL